MAPKKEVVPSQLQLCGLKSPVDVRGSEVSMGRLAEDHRRGTFYNGAVVSGVASRQKGCRLDSCLCGVKDAAF